MLMWAGMKYEVEMFGIDIPKTSIRARFEITNYMCSVLNKYCTVSDEQQVDGLLNKEQYCVKN